MSEKELAMIHVALVKCYGDIGNLLYNKLKEYIKILLDS